VIVHGFLDHSMDGVNTVIPLDKFPLQQFIGSCGKCGGWCECTDDRSSLLGINILDLFAERKGSI